MIIHLAAAGVPVSWTIVAIYRNAYGIALDAAANWHKQSIEGGKDNPQCVIGLIGDDENGWTMKRSNLFMEYPHLERQKPDDGNWLVQTHTAPLPLSDVLAKAIADALRARLIERGYLIPRAEWEQRYPAQALTSRRFAEFSAAQDAWQTAHPDIKEPMPFDLRWAPFMQAPIGHMPPYAVGENCVYQRKPGRKWEVLEAPELSGLDDFGSQVQLLNSGWTPQEVAVLLTKEPVSVEQREEALTSPSRPR